jgi:glutamate-5-semialdehyde dehydrogenase
LSHANLNTEEYAISLCKKAREAATLLAALPSQKKDAALRRAAASLRAQAAFLGTENAKDIEAGRDAGLSRAMLDRLDLTPERIEEMAAGLEQVASLTDPVGEIIRGWRRPNGLLIQKVRVPIGVIFVIYESRPNVTADAAGLCLKSGNAAILRTGREARRSGAAVASVISAAIEAEGLPAAAVQIVGTSEHSFVTKLLKMPQYINLVVPRGGKALIKAVVEESLIPTIKHYEGICHTFVDATADAKMASDICFNAKVQRPAVCNAMETMLVHESVAREFLPVICARLMAAGVALRGDDASRAICPSMKAATEEDWSTEYLDLILSIKVVKDVSEAIRHIRVYGSAHSDAIVSRDWTSIEKFVNEVDSSAVFVNTSTRFNDGGQFGFGAEIGISTDKLHARGPMALEELTSYKYVVYGSGQLRQ